MSATRAGLPGAAALLALALAGCGDGGEEGASAGQRLEAAAIARGAIADPATSDIGGAYGRDSDRLCLTGSGAERRLGIFAYYGENLSCTARGTARRDGETLAITLTGSETCRFDARFDGEAISFPGRLPAECAAFCDSPASLAGVGVTLLSHSAAEAGAMRGGDGAPLCPSGN